MGPSPDPLTEAQGEGAMVTPQQTPRGSETGTPDVRGEAEQESSFPETSHRVPTDGWDPDRDDHRN